MLISTVRTIESRRDITRQPGMNRTCACLPGRLVKRNIDYRSTPGSRRPCCSWLVTSGVRRATLPTDDPFPSARTLPRVTSIAAIRKFLSGSRRRDPASCEATGVVEEAERAVADRGSCLTAHMPNEGAPKSLGQSSHAAASRWRLGRPDQRLGQLAHPASQWDGVA